MSSNEAKTLKAPAVTEGDWRQIERYVLCGDVVIGTSALVGQPAEFLANTRMLAASKKLAEAAAMGHADLPGLPCGDLLAAANVLRNHGGVELAERLEAKHDAEYDALILAGYTLLNRIRSAK